MDRRAIVVMPPDAADRDLVVSALEACGTGVEVHDRARSALAAVRATAPHLVVHSCDLSDMGGATFHSAIRWYSGGRARALAILPAGTDPGAAAVMTASVTRPLEREPLEGQLRGILGLPAGEGAGEAARDGAPEAPGGEPAETAAGDPAPEQAPAAAIPAAAPEAPAADPPPAPVELPDLERTGPGLASVRAIGLGPWGGRVAEALGALGAASRATRDPAGRTLEPSAVARDLAADEEAALAVVAVDLGTVAATVAAALLVDLAEAAPGVGRMAIVRLPAEGAPLDERERALRAIQSALEAAAASVLPVQPSDAGGPAGAEVDELAHGLALVTGGTGRPIREAGMAGVTDVLSAPGFLGLRVAHVERADLARGRVDLVPVTWQPAGFAWREAGGVVGAFRAPVAWLEADGLAGLERLAAAAGAPAALGLYAGGDAGRAVVVAAGMSLPASLRALREGLDADRDRLAEKRRRALDPIPFADPGEGRAGR